MGCTGSGIPKKTPVTMFHRPENTKVVDKEMELLTAKAIIRGSSVPRSPSEPEISARGDFRKVATLFRCKVWIFGNTMVSFKVEFPFKIQIIQGYKICPLMDFWENGPCDTEPRASRIVATVVVVL